MKKLLQLMMAGAFANALVIACVTSTDDSADDGGCTPGATTACMCDDGSRSTKECNASGTAYGVCDCSHIGSGGSSNSAGAPNGGAETLGGAPTTQGGAGAGGAAGEGGAPTGEAGNGGAAAGASGASGGAGGEGGSGGELPVFCQNPVDDCETCYTSRCCTEWAACAEDATETCSDEVFAILQCTDEIRFERNVLTADLQACAEDVATGGGGWSSGVSPLTVAVIDCIAGGDGWEGSPWGNDSCNAGCFQMLP